VPQESILQTVENGGAGWQTLDRCDSLAFDLASRYETRTNGLAIEQDRAGAAIARIAAHFSSGETEIFPQHARKPLLGPGGDGNFTIVDLQLELAFGF